MSDYSEAEQYERAKDWIKTNGLWIVAGIAIGALGLAGWRWYQERRITQAETVCAVVQPLPLPVGDDAGLVEPVSAVGRNEVVGGGDALAVDLLTGFQRAGLVA